MLIGRAVEGMDLAQKRVAMRQKCGRSWQFRIGIQMDQKRVNELHE